MREETHICFFICLFSCSLQGVDEEDELQIGEETQGEINPEVKWIFDLPPKKYVRPWRQGKSWNLSYSLHLEWQLRLKFAIWLEEPKKKYCWGHCRSSTIPAPIPPRPHTYSLASSPQGWSLLGGGGRLIFLRLLVGVGLPRGGQRGKVDHTSEREGRRQGGKETSKPGLNNTGSRPRDSIF